jgi:hypothetical protein
MTSLRALRVVPALALAAALSGSILPLESQAETLPFKWDFNPLAAGVNSANGPDSIETYMEGVFGSDITVKLGAQTRKTRMDGLTSLSFFLGNTDGATDRGFYPAKAKQPPLDTFLINRWNDAKNVPNLHERDRITITFEEQGLDWIAFDWEIFPVVKGSNEPADITFRACKKSERIADTKGVLLCPADPAHTFMFFDLGPKGSPEKELGDLGHFPQNIEKFFFASAMEQFEWIDWNTAPVGLDNLEGGVLVPQPGSLLLIGSALLALGSLRKARRR